MGRAARNQHAPCYRAAKVVEPIKHTLIHRAGGADMTVIVGGKAGVRIIATQCFVELFGLTFKELIVFRFANQRRTLDVFCHAFQRVVAQPRHELSSCACAESPGAVLDVPERHWKEVLSGAGVKSQI